MVGDGNCRYCPFAFNLFGSQSALDFFWRHRNHFEGDILSPEELHAFYAEDGCLRAELNGHRQLTGSMRALISGLLRRLKEVHHLSPKDEEEWGQVLFTLQGQAEQGMKQYSEEKTVLWTKRMLHAPDAARYVNFQPQQVMQSVKGRDCAIYTDVTSMDRELQEYWQEVSDSDRLEQIFTFLTEDVH